MRLTEFERLLLWSSATLVLFAVLRETLDLTVEMNLPARGASRTVQLRKLTEGSRIGPSIGLVFSF